MFSKQTQISILTIVVAVLAFLQFSKRESDESLTVLPQFNEQTERWGFANTRTMQLQLSRGLNQLNKYFGGEVIIHRHEPAPGGVMEIEAEIDGAKRVFYVLADGSTLIEGKLLSPFMDSRHVDGSSSNGMIQLANTNQHQQDQFNANKEKLSKSIESKVGQNKPNFTANKQANTVAKSAPKMSPSPLRLPENNQIFDKHEFYNKTQTLEYIEYGDQEAPEIFVYVDLNCPGCREAKGILDKYTSSGQLRVKYIPVGIIRDDSPFKAAYSLIPDKNEDRQKLMDYFKQPAKFDALVRTKAPEEEFLRGLRAVRKSNQVMMMLPKKLTPTFLIKDQGVVSIANITSEAGVKRLVEQLNRK